MKYKAELGEEAKGPPLFIRGGVGGGGGLDDNSMGSWDYQAEYQEQHHTPTTIVMDKGSDMGGYRLTTADHMVFLVYGYHIHHKDVKYLGRGAANDAVCQCCW